MTYTVSILRRAQRELQRLPQEDYERVREALRALAHNPRPAGCLALTGRAGWASVWGIIVSFTTSMMRHTLSRFSTGHRRDVYR